MNFGGILVGGFGRARGGGAMADESGEPASLETKSTRQLVRERAQAEREMLEQALTTLRTQVTTTVLLLLLLRRLGRWR